MKNPIKLELYRSPATFCAFAGGRHVGWIIQKDKGFEARPSNGWRVCLFPSRPHAERYLIATLTKTK